MAKADARTGAPKKKPRHSAAQKRAAAKTREQSARTARIREKARSRRSGTDAPEREERPRREQRSTERRDRPSYDRGERSERRDRPSYDRGERSERRDRPAYERGERRDRPSYDRPERRERPSYDRGGRDDRRERPAYDRQRPVREHRRPHESDGQTLRAREVHAETRHQPRGSEPRRPAELAEDNGFLALGLDRGMVQRLAETGIVDPFPIQVATIPDALAGRDLLGRGQTGSGKTLAFGLPTIQRLAAGERARPKQPRAVVLTPTRELAMQVLDALRPLLGALGLRHQLIAGGMSYTPQLSALEKGVDLLVATPGRLIDLIEQGAADLSAVEVTVLDEADHMAQMGFLEAITEILDLTPTDGQRLLFSATLDHGIDVLAKRYLTDPVTHSTQDATASVDTMEHHVFLVHPHHKRLMTAAVANRDGRTLVFVRTKLGADRVALQLRESGVLAAALHGGLNQAARNRVLEAFKAGDVPVLVATDVAARGIHVDEISLVMQVDPPADHKDYLHRSGRTARAGEKGVVVTLALPHQKRTVARLLDAAGVDAEPVVVAPEDRAVIETAGGRMPSEEPIPQSRLDALLAPRRPARRPGGRGGGPGRGRGERRFGGQQRGGPRGGGRPSRERARD